jgi:hypothetical protein
MNRTRYIYYDDRSLKTEKDLEISFDKFLLSIKEKILQTTDKLIYEKKPVRVHRVANPTKSRYITTTDDFLLVFTIGDPKDIALVWYKDYYKENHCSIYSGRAIILESKIYAHTEFFIKQNTSNVFSCVVCNFSRYQLPNFINQHQFFNLTTNYNII